MPAPSVHVHAVRSSRLPERLSLSGFTAARPTRVSLTLFLSSRPHTAAQLTLTASENTPYTFPFPSSGTLILERSLRLLDYILILTCTCAPKTKI